jgi:hypothetical protein
MFEPRIFPYMNRGRWYEFRIVSDGKEILASVSPSLDASYSGGYIKLPAGYHIIDIKYDISFLTDEKSDVLTPSIKSYAGGVQAFPIPKAEKFDHLTAWVFANFNE